MLTHAEAIYYAANLLKTLAAKLAGKPGACADLSPHSTVDLNECARRIAVDPSSAWRLEMVSLARTYMDAGLDPGPSPSHYTGPKRLFDEGGWAGVLSVTGIGPSETRQILQAVRHQAVMASLASSAIHTGASPVSTLAASPKPIGPGSSSAQVKPLPSFWGKPGRTPPGGQQDVLLPDDTPAEEPPGTEKKTSKAMVVGAIVGAVVLVGGALYYATKDEGAA